MLERVLELLEHMRRRPAMFAQPLGIATIQSYLHGLQAGCACAGLDVSREQYQAAAAARGWKWRALGIIWHMRAKKLDEAAIIQELIAVQEEAFRRAASANAKG